MKPNLYQFLNISFQEVPWTSFQWNKQSSPVLPNHRQVIMRRTFVILELNILCLCCHQVQSATQPQAPFARSRVPQTSTYAWARGCWSQVKNLSEKRWRFLLQYVIFFCSRIVITDAELLPDLRMVNIVANVDLFMHGINALDLLRRVQDTALEWEPRDP